MSPELYPALENAFSLDPIKDSSLEERVFPIQEPLPSGEL